MSTERPARLALCSVLLAVMAVSCSSTSAGCPDDALQARALADLGTFERWLRRHDVEGFVGETGWPGTRDTARWNALGETWFAAADNAGLPVTVWAAGEWWPADYPLGVYRSGARRPGSPLGSAGPQAEVLEAHLDTVDAFRGVSDGSGSFGTDLPGYSAERPGTYGRDYSYPGPRSLGYLAARGVRTVRLAFTWERVQPEPGGELSATEVQRLRHVVGSARRAGVDVLLDLHSYGRYRVAGPDGTARELVLGTDELPPTALADVWRRLAVAFSREDGVAGYGLMNEPHDLPGPRGGAAVWEQASQLAVQAVRETDRETPVMVASATWSRISDWAVTHPKPWIDDSADAVRYEAHQYFDEDGSGAYRRGYAAELAAAEAGRRREGERTTASCG